MDNFEIIIPNCIENLQLPSPDLLNFYKDINNRVFWIDDEIDIRLMELTRYIMRWNREDAGVPVEERTPIRIMFFSPGGELDTYRALADVIKLSVTPVYGIVIGVAYSAAAMIFLSCHKKFMLKSASLLFHKGSSTMGGSFNEVQAAMTEYREQVEEMVNAVCSHSNYTQDEVREKMNFDWYIRPNEAIERGVCDQIVDDISLLY